MDLVASNRKKAMEDIKNSLGSNRDDPELHSKISRFLESLNTEHKSLGLGLPANIDASGLKKMDASSQKRLQQIFYNNLMYLKNGGFYKE